MQKNILVRGMINEFLQGLAFTNAPHVNNYHLIEDNKRFSNK